MHSGELLSKQPLKIVSAMNNAFLVTTVHPQMLWGCIILGKVLGLACSSKMFLCVKVLQFSFSLGNSSMAFPVLSHYSAVYVESLRFHESLQLGSCEGCKYGLSGC